MCKNVATGDNFMNYELDFIGVSEQTKDADAIGIHWIDNDVHTIRSHKRQNTEGIYKRANSEMVQQAPHQRLRI